MMSISAAASGAMLNLMMKLMICCFFIGFILIKDRFIIFIVPVSLDVVVKDRKTAVTVIVTHVLTPIHAVRHR